MLYRTENMFSSSLEMNEIRKIFIKILGEVQNTITFNLRKSVVTELFPTHQSNRRKIRALSGLKVIATNGNFLFQLQTAVRVRINKTKLTWFKVSLLFSSQTSNNAFIRFKFDNGGQESTIPPLTEYTSDQFSSIQRRGELQPVNIMQQCKLHLQY